MSVEEDSQYKPHLAVLVREAALAQCKLGLHIAEGALRFCTGMKSYRKDQRSKVDCKPECEGTADTSKTS